MTVYLDGTRIDSERPRWYFRQRGRSCYVCECMKKKKKERTPEKLEVGSAMNNRD